MPNDSMCSRFLVSASTDHCSSPSSEGGTAQIWFTPNAAITFRMSSLSPCCVPNLRLALRFEAGVEDCGPPSATARFASDEVATAPANVPAARCKKSLRFMRVSVTTCTKIALLFQRMNACQLASSRIEGSRSLHLNGEMAEWLKAHAWKACIP